MPRELQNSHVPRGSLTKTKTDSSKCSAAKSFVIFSFAFEVSNIHGVALELVVLLDFASVSLFTEVKLKSEHITQLQSLLQPEVSS